MLNFMWRFAELWQLMTLTIFYWSHCHFTSQPLFLISKTKVAIMTFFKKTKQPLITSILCISAVAGISGTALAATPQDCAGGYSLAVTTANANFQKAIQACVAQPGAGVSSCVQTAVDAHKTAIETAHTNFDNCMATAVPPTH